MMQQRAWSGMAVVLLAGAMPGCVGLVGPSNTPSASGIKQINHIIVMAQENRGFDHYFGAMRQYWAANGIADQAFDGLPQLNPMPGAVPTNPGCDPAFPPPSACTTDSSSPAIASFSMISMCVENPSPFWNEDHVDWNLSNPVSATPTLDGFVWTAANDARNIQPPFTDTDGVRAMGYYDGTALPYYYFMASKFATSDRWFSPLMSRTQPNRMYLLAATSAGHVYPLQPGASPLTNKTIVDLLQSAGVTWKIYVTDMVYANPPVQDSALGMFTAGTTYSNNIVPVSQFLTDLKNGTLPAVSYIEPGYNSGLDEHPGESDAQPGGSVQVGSQYVSTLINALMQSSSWKDSAFILTFDEFGGFYDHVPPQPAVSPDGIPPSDLQPGDACTVTTGPNCDFTYTGYRVPLIVVSPFAKKNYVSHTVADSTATLKFIETRFGLSSLTKRDAAQMDMTEFFDFTNAPWATPPANIPTQPTNGQCYMTHLP